MKRLLTLLIIMVNTLLSQHPVMFDEYPDDETLLEESKIMHEIETDHFKVIITDDSLNVNYFYNNEKKEQIYYVIESVFKDVEKMFVFQNNSNKIIYRLDAIDNPSFPPAIGDQLYQIFKENKSGIIEGYVMKTIKSGEYSNQFDEYSSVIFQGLLLINFNYEFNYDLKKSSINNYDLYTYLLRNLFSSFGISSLISQHKTSVFSNQKIGLFSRYDDQLYYNYNGEQIKVISNNNNTVKINDLLYDIDIQNSNNNFVCINGVEEYKIFAPNAWDYGKSLNYLDNDSCLMKANLTKSEILRKPNIIDYEILCKLGYELTGEFSSKETDRHQLFDKCGNNVAAKNDYFEDTTGVLELTLSDIISNDINTQIIKNIKIVYKEGKISLSTNKLTDTDDTLTIITEKAYHNRYILEYTPVSEDIIGSTGYIIIDIYQPFPECEYNCNYICNPGFEISNDYGEASRHGISQYTDKWYVYGSTDFFFRNGTKYINRGRKSYGIWSAYTFPTYMIPSKFYDMPMMPETWDYDNNNMFYMAYLHGIIYNMFQNLDVGWSSERIGQELKNQLKNHNNYILDYRANFTTQSIYAYENKYNEYFNIIKNMIEDSVFSLTYLTNAPDKEIYKTDSIFVYKNYDDIQIIDNTQLKRNQWSHIKKSFTYDSSYKYIMFFSDQIKFALDSFQIDSPTIRFFFDDIIIRDQYISFNMTLDNQFPCIGDTVHYTIELWKDVSDDIIDLTVIDTLPKGLEYIGGDFTQTGNILSSNVSDTDFIEDKKYLHINAVVTDSAYFITDLVNKAFIKDFPEECMNSLGKNEFEIFPGINPISIDKEIMQTDCKNTPLIVRLTISNLSPNGNPVEFFETVSDGMRIKDSSVTINGLPAQMNVIADNSYQHVGYKQLWFRTLNVPPLVNGLSSEMILEYEVYNDSAISEMYFTTSVHQSGNCKEELTWMIEYEKPRSELPIQIAEEYYGCDSVVIELPGFKTFLWSNGDRDNKTTITKTGNYSVIIYDEYDCRQRTDFYVEISPSQNIYAEKDTIEGEISINKNINVYFEIDEFTEITKGLLKLTFPRKYMNITSDFKLVSEDDSLKVLQDSVIYDQDDEDYVLKNLMIQFYSISPKTEKVIIEYFNDECNRYSCDTLYVKFSSPTDNSKIIKDFSDDFEIFAFPNPNSGELKLRIQIAYSSDIQILLYDLTGKKAILHEGAIPKGAYEFTFDISEFASGMYSLEMIINNRYKRYYKILLQK